MHYASVKVNSHLSPDASTPSGLEGLTHAYLESFEARDLERCLEFFADDSFIDFQMTTYHGRAAIERWHGDRFAADLRIKSIESVCANGDVVTIKAVISSKRLAAWKIASLSGQVTIRFEMGKIKECRLSL